MTDEEIKALEEKIDNTKEAYKQIIYKDFTKIYDVIKHIRRIRKAYKKELFELKHQPDFTYVDLNALTILFVSLVIIDVVSLVTKLLGWW